ncbi:MAG: hypothetical protein WBA77_19960 [Microcoleaceae cyanobacterium]
MIQVNLLPGAIYELMVSVSDRRSITQADRYGLMAAILDESLSEEEHRCIDRLLRSILRGRIQVVTDLSAMS